MNNQEKSSIVGYETSNPTTLGICHMPTEWGRGRERETGREGKREWRVSTKTSHTLIEAGRPEQQARVGKQGRRNCRAGLT